MPDGRMARADLVTGIVLFVLSVAVIYGAWTMDRLEVRQIHPLSVPGILPGLLGLALAICSVMLVAKSLRPAPPLAGRSAVAGAEPDSGAFRRLAIAVVLCLVYALGLVGWAPFWLATAVFVAAFILAFEWAEANSPQARLRSLAWALAIGLATGWSVAYAFSELFLVRLP
jgi:hypothetical protein